MTHSGSSSGNTESQPKSKGYPFPGDKRALIVRAPKCFACGLILKDILANGGLTGFPIGNGNLEVFPVEGKIYHAILEGICDPTEDRKYLAWKKGKKYVEGGIGGLAQVGEGRRIKISGKRAGRPKKPGVHRRGV